MPQDILHLIESLKNSETFPMWQETLISRAFAYYSLVCGMSGRLFRMFYYGVYPRLLNVLVPLLIQRLSLSNGSIALPARGDTAMHAVTYLSKVFKKAI